MRTASARRDLSEAELHQVSGGREVRLPDVACALAVERAGRAVSLEPGGRRARPLSPDALSRMLFAADVCDRSPLALAMQDAARRAAAQRQRGAR